MKVSIITVSYNSADTIRDTLQSVAEQTHQDVEYLIVDGGSSDTTLDVVACYSKTVTKYISEPDSGIYDAMNKGIRLASGDIVGILNSDDFYIHDKVLTEVDQLFSSDPELEILLGDVDFVCDGALDHPMRKYSTGNFKPWMLRFGLMPPHPAVFVRKSTYQRVGLYKRDYKIAADFDFLTRLFLLDRPKYRIVHKTWVRMRMGGASTNGLQSNIISTREMKRSMHENKLYTNSLMLMFRLPFKFFTQVLRK